MFYFCKFQCINPNPHFYKAITKLTVLGWKKPLLSHPLHSTVRISGGRGCFLCSTEHLLNKQVRYTHLITKSSLKVTFFWKTPKAKSFVRHFWF
jgi:hypothetical protein